MVSPESPTDLPSNPGSYNDFMQKHGLQDGPEAIRQHSAALVAFRDDLLVASGLGSLQELHSAPFTLVEPERAAPIGSIALAETA